ncbi:MAG: protoheme IX farnesyltransferase [Desulfobacterota bacterium]|nr:protoheme IX farnesyltransferase [Thermodesulfobacteriota bacterium]
MRSMLALLSLLADLTKWKLSLFVALSAATGYLLADRTTPLEMVPMLLATFLLASGASGLNQYQERREDGLMERTKGRPIPSGRLSPEAGLLISILLLFFGSISLLLAATWKTFLLAMSALFLYNAVYTPLKKRTLLAIVPGAWVGAIPPAMGWTSGGGGIEPQILALCTFLFLWQFPHTYFLLQSYRKDYLKAGFAPLLQRGEDLLPEKVLWVWIMATVVSSLLIPFFGSDPSLWNLFVLTSLGLLLIYKTTRRLLFGVPRGSLRFAFRAVNLYMLSVLLLLNLDRIVRIG